MCSLPNQQWLQVEKGICATEFAALRSCFRVAVSFVLRTSCQHTPVSVTHFLGLCAGPYFIVLQGTCLRRFPACRVTYEETLNRTADVPVAKGIVLLLVGRVIAPEANAYALHLLHT